MPFTILFGWISNVNILICAIMPIYVAACKILFGAYSLKQYEKTGNTINENKPVKFIWGIVGICLILAYGLPYIGITVPDFVFAILTVITVILAIFACIYIKKFNMYREMYKQILTSSNMNVQTNAQEITKENVHKQIDISKEITSNKKDLNILMIYL